MMPGDGVRQAIFVGILVVAAGAAAADVPVRAPLAAKAFHAGWFLEGPSEIGTRFDYPRETGSRYMVRNDVMPGDGVEIDIFVSDEKTTRQGILIRNENDRAADVTLSGCGFIQMFDPKGNTNFQTTVAVDAPGSAVLHVTLPPRNFIAANLSPPDRPSAYYPAMPKFGPGISHQAGFQCSSIQISHPPS